MEGTFKWPLFGLDIVLFLSAGIGPLKGFLRSAEVPEHRQEELTQTLI